MYAYVAITRRPGFAPPVRESDDAQRQREEQLYDVPIQLWAPEERAARLGAAGVVVYRRAYPVVFNALLFAFVILVSIGVAVVEGSVGGWAVMVAAIVVAVLSARAAVRAFRIAVIIDADGLTVRNVQRTHRVAWDTIVRIVPPSADDYRCLRIDLRRGRSVRCTALSASTFQRAGHLDRQAAELTALVGPAPESVSI